MALSTTLINKYYMGGGGVMAVYAFTAAGSGDTLAVTLPGGTPFQTQFMDANANEINTTPPTFGAWTTSGGVSTATLTANAGGVVTAGRMILIYGGN